MIYWDREVGSVCLYFEVGLITGIHIRDAQLLVNLVHRKESTIRDFFNLLSI